MEAKARLTIKDLYTELRIAALELTRNPSVPVVSGWSSDTVTPTSTKSQVHAESQAWPNPFYTLSLFLSLGQKDSTNFRRCEAICRPRINKTLSDSFEDTGMISVDKQTNSNLLSMPLALSKLDGWSNDNMLHQQLC